jgi:hypothetical protein
MRIAGSENGLLNWNDKAYAWYVNWFALLRHPVA